MRHFLVIIKWHKILGSVPPSLELAQVLRKAKAIRIPYLHFVNIYTQGRILYYCTQEGGAVSRVNIGSLITASVTSRHTSVIFKMAGKFLVRYVAKDVNFLNVWIHLLPSSIRQSF